MLLVELGLRLAHASVVVQAGEQEERLHDVLHPATHRLERLLRVGERELDLIFYPPRRVLANSAARAAGDKDHVPDGDTVAGMSNVPLHRFLGPDSISCEARAPFVPLIAHRSVSSGFSSS